MKVKVKCPFTKEGICGNCKQGDDNCIIEAELAEPPGGELRDKLLAELKGEFVADFDWILNMIPPHYETPRKIIKIKLAKYQQKE